MNKHKSLSTCKHGHYMALIKNALVPFLVHVFVKHKYDAVRVQGQLLFAAKLYNHISIVMVSEKAKT